MKKINEMNLKELEKFKKQIEDRIYKLKPDYKPREVEGSGGAPAIEF